MYPKNLFLICILLKRATCLCLFIFITLWPAMTESAIKIDKNTIEMLNNGLKALVSIKQILSTIQAFSELSSLLNKEKAIINSSGNTSGISNINNPLLLPHVLYPAPNRPRFVQKIFRKLPFSLLTNHKAQLNLNKATQSK